MKPQALLWCAVVLLFALPALAGPATVDLAAPANGVLVKKLAGEDEPVAVGQRLGCVHSDD